jgi:hypothetical protein
VSPPPPRSVTQPSGAGEASDPCWTVGAVLNQERVTRRRIRGMDGRGGVLVGSESSILDPIVKKSCEGDLY